VGCFGVLFLEKEMLMRKLIAGAMAIALAIAATGCAKCAKCGSTEACATCETAARDAPAEK
jgi:hypothetical protein